MTEPVPTPDPRPNPLKAAVAWFERVGTSPVRVGTSPVTARPFAEQLHREVYGPELARLRDETAQCHRWRVEDGAHIRHLEAEVAEVRARVRAQQVESAEHARSLRARWSESAAQVEASIVTTQNLRDELTAKTIRNANLRSEARVAREERDVVVGNFDKLRTDRDRTRAALARLVLTATDSWSPDDADFDGQVTAAEAAIVGLRDLHDSMGAESWAEMRKQRDEARTELESSRSSRGAVIPDDARTQIRDYLTGWLPARLSVPYDDTHDEVAMALAVSLVDNVIASWGAGNTIPADAGYRIAAKIVTRLIQAGVPLDQHQQNFLPQIVKDELAGWGAVTNPTDGQGAEVLCREEIFPAWSNRWLPCGSAIGADGRCTAFGHLAAAPVVPAPAEDAEDSTGRPCECPDPDWYHDGVAARVDGRLCRKCRRREGKEIAREAWRTGAWPKKPAAPSPAGDAAPDTEAEQALREDAEDRLIQGALRPPRNGCLLVDLKPEWKRGDKALWRLADNYPGQECEVMHVVGSSALVTAGGQTWNVDLDELTLPSAVSQRERDEDTEPREVVEHRSEFRELPAKPGRWIATCHRGDWCDIGTRTEVDDSADRHYSDTLAVTAPLPPTQED